MSSVNSYMEQSVINQNLCRLIRNILKLKCKKKGGRGGNGSEDLCDPKVMFVFLLLLRSPKRTVLIDINFLISGQPPSSPLPPI